MVMNELTLLRAFGDIDDRYILESPIKENKRKKMNKRLPALLAAAVLAVTGVLGAGAYYVNDGAVWAGVRWRFRDTSADVDTSPLDGITTHDGMMIKSTFQDLEVTFAGAVCDNDEEYAIFNIRRTDGTPFTAPQGYTWTAGMTEISYAGAPRLLGRVKEMAPAPRSSLNEDGTLSVAVPGMDILQIYDLAADHVFGIMDLYCVPEDYWYSGGSHSEVYILGEEAMTRYQSEDSSGWKDLADKYLDAMEAISVESFRGYASCRVAAESLKADIPEYQFSYEGSPARMEISPIKMTVRGEGDHTFTGQTLEVFYLDGTSEELSPGNYMTGGGLWYFTYTGTRPISAASIDHVVFDGQRVDVR